MYALADYHHISVHPSVFITMAAHFAGLLASSFFIKNIRVAKKLMLFTIVFCIAASVVFFLKPSWLWTAAGLTFSMLMLGMAFLFALRLPQEELPTGVLLSGQKNTSLNNTGPLAFLCLFIAVQSL